MGELMRQFPTSISTKSYDMHRWMSTQNVQSTLRDCETPAYRVTANNTEGLTLPL